MLYSFLNFCAHLFHRENRRSWLDFWKGMFDIFVNSSNVGAWKFLKAQVIGFLVRKKSWNSL